MEVTSRLVQVAMRSREVRTPGGPVAGVRRLVVVRQDRLGDLVLTLPAIEALRAVYPEAELGLVVAPELSDVREWLGGVDRIFAVSRTRRSVGEVFAEFGPDLVVSISRQAHAALAAVRAGVPARVGTGFRFFSPLFTRCVNEHRRTAGRHELEYALSFAHRVGAPGREPSVVASGSEHAAERVEAWLSARGLPVDGCVVVHPGSGGSCPSWPLDHYIVLLQALRDRGVPVVVTLGPGEEELEAALERASPGVGTIPRFRQSTAMLWELTGCAGLVVSNSTAPIHMAALRGTPTLAIHAPWPSCGPERWGPYGAAGWALVADTAGADEWPRRERARRAAALMAGVSPDEVLERLVSIRENRRASAN